MSELILVGELNPYGADPQYALYPYPRMSAGGRLQSRVLGISLREYVALDRANLCEGAWSAGAARARAASIMDDGQWSTIVMLGRKVATAFRCDADSPFTSRASLLACDRTVTLVFLPHPSGLCRLWNEPGAFERARALVAAAAPHAANWGGGGG